MTEATPKTAFRPIYGATVIPGEITNETSVKGTPYMKITGSQVTSKKSGLTVTRTVMVFGKSIDMVGALLETGKAVDLAVQNDGGTIKVIGEILPPKAAAQG